MEESKEIRFKKYCLIVYIVLLVAVIWLYPGYAFWESHMKGWDSGDTAMGLFFAVVPIGVAVISFLYALFTADVKKTLAAFLIVFAPVGICSFRKRYDLNTDIWSRGTCSRSCWMVFKYMCDR